MMTYTYKFITETNYYWGQYKDERNGEIEIEKLKKIV